MPRRLKGEAVMRTVKTESAMRHRVKNFIVEVSSKGVKSDVQVVVANES